MGKSRNEAILENMLGASNELEEAKSRIERLLMQILEQGSVSKPTVAGKYALQVTIEDDEPVYEWVAIEAVG